MIKSKHLFLCLICLVILALAETVYYTPRLPETVASHFGGDGRPDGWSSKAGFLWAFWIMFGSMSAMFGAIWFFVPRVPDSLVNLPDKEYWLAPERRARTHEHIRSLILELGVATLIFMAFCQHQVLRFNLGQSERIEYFWPAMILLLLWVIVRSIVNVRYFYKKPASES